MKECVFLGFEEGVKGFRVWDLKKRKVEVARDVHFDEETFPFELKIGKEAQSLPQKKIEACTIYVRSEHSDDGPDDVAADEQLFPEMVEPGEGVEPGVEPVVEVIAPAEQLIPVMPVRGEGDQPSSERADDVDVVLAEQLIPERVELGEAAEPDGDQAEIVAPRRSERNRIEKNVCILPCCRACKVKSSDCLSTLFYSAPSSFAEALNRPDCDEWLEAMREEIENHKENGTWELVMLPKSLPNVVGSKLVFTVKVDGSGSIVKRKARLVAQGYTQVYGVDYWETFCPVIRRESLRVMFAIAVSNGWVIEQMDVVAAYLNGGLQETVFMSQPEGFASDDPNQVCLLKKSIYGLHQSGKVWSDFLCNVLLRLGFDFCDGDPCVFIKEGIMLGTYVDDLILIGEQDIVSLTKRQLSEIVKIKDLGPASHFVGFTIRRLSSERLTIDQGCYIEDTLKEFNMSECAGVASPCVPGNWPEEDNSEPFDEVVYRKAVGRLLDVANCTRPDIAFAVSRLSRFNHCPTIFKWKELKRVLRYLKETLFFKLHFVKCNGVLNAYCDADWANDKSDSISVGGCLINMGGPVIWRSKKQGLVATSTVMAEYISMYDCCRELDWHVEFLNEVRFCFRVPAVLFCDNQGAISIANSRKVSQQTKHIRFRYHFVRECVSLGTVVLKYVCSKENVADVFTKGLSGPCTADFCKSLGLA